MIILHFQPEFIVEESHQEIIDGKEIRVIDKFRLMNVALVAEPVYAAVLETVPNRAVGSNPTECTRRTNRL